MDSFASIVGYVFMGAGVVVVVCVVGAVTWMWLGNAVYFYRGVIKSQELGHDPYVPGYTTERFYKTRLFFSFVCSPRYMISLTGSSSIHLKGVTIDFMEMIPKIIIHKTQ